MLRQIVVLLVVLEVTWAIDLPDPESPSIANVEQTPSSPTAPPRAAAATIPPLVTRSGPLSQPAEGNDFKLTFATSYPMLVWILVASLVVNLLLVSCLCRAYSRKNTFCC